MLAFLLLLIFCLLLGFPAASCCCYCCCCGRGAQQPHCFPEAVASSLEAVAAAAEQSPSLALAFVASCNCSFTLLITRIHEASHKGARDERPSICFFSTVDVPHVIEDAVDASNVGDLALSFSPSASHSSSRFPFLRLNKSSKYITFAPFAVQQTFCDETVCQGILDQKSLIAPFRSRCSSGRLSDCPLTLHTHAGNSRPSLHELKTDGMIDGGRRGCVEC